MKLGRFPHSETDLKREPFQSSAVASAFAPAAARTRSDSAVHRHNRGEAGLAFGLSAPELGLGILPFALVSGAVTASLVLYEMLTRDRLAKATVTGLFVTVLVAILVIDVLL